MAEVRLNHDEAEGLIKLWMRAIESLEVLGGDDARTHVLVLHLREATLMVADRWLEGGDA